ncbi:MAG: MBL fold metallo-hydrolase [Bacteroidaceae bacterium]|nr:MBL fold metallo-hydrolase [Bacteroidaceae bacterium]
MTLTYIFHSGFMLETERNILVFDFWLDPAHVMDSALQSEKQMYVFSSHFHEDHFTRAIFEWKKKKDKVTYILSKDIMKRRRAEAKEADVWLAKGGRWSDGEVSVRACGSTDSGVSWIVDFYGKRIFHAGDLNNWYARFLSDNQKEQIVYSEEHDEGINPTIHEKHFLGELKDIRKCADSFDLVMFPIDGRIGNGYTRGGRQFIERFRVGWFVPMHFVLSGFESAWRFKEYAEAKNIRFWEIRKEGDHLEL